MRGEKTQLLEVSDTDEDQTENFEIDYEIIEAMFFAYRDFVSDPDLVLKEFKIRQSAPPDYPFCQPSARINCRRIARYFEYYQAKFSESSKATDPNWFY